VEEQRQMTDKDLPEGVRLILIGALELVGTILGGADLEEVREQAEFLFAVVTEHVEINGGTVDVGEL
jgi:hypothetical protein